jgi:hypothetical protein
MNSSKIRENHCIIIYIFLKLILIFKGCGLAVSSLNKVYCVCNYAPPGNYEGEFKENVLPPI